MSKMEKKKKAKKQRKGKDYIVIKLEYKKTTGIKMLKTKARKVEGVEKEKLKCTEKEKYRGKEEGGGGEGRTR